MSRKSLIHRPHGHSRRCCHDRRLRGARRATRARRRDPGPRRCGTDQGPWRLRPAAAFKMGLLQPRQRQRPGLEHDGVQCAEAGREGPGRRGFVRRAEAGPGVVREGLPRFRGAGLPADPGPRQRVRGCGEGGGEGLPERAVLHLVQPARGADRHRPEHQLGRAALPDGRDRRRRCARRPASWAAWKSRPSPRR